MSEEISKLRDEVIEIALQKLKEIMSKEINPYDGEVITRINGVIDVLKHLN